MTYEQLEARITAWMRARPDIWAAVVVGSRARVEHPADEWSDLDLVLFVADPSPYTSGPDWLAEIGDTWMTYLDDTGHGDPEWFALFEGDLKLDVALVAAPLQVSQAGLREILESSPYSDVFERGMRVVLDRSGAEAGPSFSITAPKVPAHPMEAEFSALVSRVLLGALRAAGMLKRGELWWAKQQCDCELKHCLLAMLEWHARATLGADRDTWHDGRFLEEWAAPRAVEALPATFGRYDAEDVWRALHATLDLFRRLALELAAALRYAYPTQVDARIVARMQEVRGRQVGT